MSTQLARNETTWWREADAAHHLHPFTDGKALAKDGGSRIITKAEGVWLTDSEGNQILDGMAGLWCVNLGYGRKELAQVAYDQMLELPYYNTFFKTATPSSVELAEKLARITPEGLNHVFYGSSGSEANDTIVRMVRHFWNLAGKPSKKIFISRNNAYHGSTMAAASLGGMAAMHGQADLPLPGFEHVMQPYWYDLGGDLTPDELGLKAAEALENRILILGAQNVAAFIGEPVQGAGGVIIPPESYWPKVQEICRKHDILLIADEVICGFGRTGNWFGCETFDIDPDIMPLAKGISSGYLPLSAVMVGERVANTLIEDGGEFYHGFTYSGHPVCCAVALENIRLLEEEKIVEQVRDDTGPYLQARLGELADHPLVGEVRGVGFLGAIELVKDKATHMRFPDVGTTGALCKDYAMGNGLVMRAVGDTLVVSPPLIMSRKEIDELVKRARETLDVTAKDLGVL
ncbi:aspartate aminotransferase family protein [Pelagibius sp. Alg239-R121]|uniref:aspartate aminotransferase family protein n=1 Tax=Pelagibius sp. Alg239-R121 TaxID=2993448 RepID=UPI0024A6CCEB|nr:aspartate aminotransferase family protein [Pelagibius sp. Alg239-R121]